MTKQKSHFDNQNGFFVLCAHLGQCAILYMSNYQSFAIAKFQLGNLAGENYRFDCSSNIRISIKMVKSY